MSRLTVVNKNIPGVLGQLTSLIGDAGVNILQTVNTSREDVAYNVVDLGEKPADVAELERCLSYLAVCERARVAFDAWMAEIQAETRRLEQAVGSVPE